MSHLAAVTGALPAHRYAQAEVTEAFAEVLGSQGVSRTLLERLHGNAGVSYRHLALPLERYAALADFGEANDEFIRVAVALRGEGGQEGAGGGLDDRRRCRPDHVDHRDRAGGAVARRARRERIDLRDDVKQVPLVGLGCVAGAAGVAASTTTSSVIRKAWPCCCRWSCAA